MYGKVMLICGGIWKDGEGLNLLERTHGHKERSCSNGQRAEWHIQLCEVDTRPNQKSFFFHTSEG